MSTTRLDNVTAGGDTPSAALVVTPTGKTALRVLQILIPASVVGAWFVASLTVDLVPRIGPTVEVLISRFRDGTITPELISTLQAVCAGYVLAALVGLTTGFLLGRSPYWYRTIEPIIGAAFAVPRILLYPVLLAIFGFGLQSKMGIGFLSAVFPIVISAMAGAREIKPILVRLSLSLGMSRFQRFRKVLLPASAPTVMAGLRMGIGSAFISVVVIEMVGAPSGLGVVVKQAYGRLDLPFMFAIILLIVLMALAFNMALALAERRLRRNVD